MGMMARTLAFVCCSLWLAGAQAQNVVSARVVGQPLVYMKAGKLDGCGIRLLVVDATQYSNSQTPVPVWDLSFNLYLPGNGAVKMGSYDVSAAELRSGKPSPKPKAVPTAAGWLKAPNENATVPLGPIGKSDDPGFILYWTELDSVLGLFKAHMSGAPILIGTRRAGAKTEKIFSGSIEMSDSENQQVLQCMTEFLAVPPGK